MVNIGGGGHSVEVADVRKSYGAVTALHPAHVRITAGQFVGVLGASGCGKSTLLRCLAGLEEPESGRISIGERVVFDAADAVAVRPRDRHLGMVFQDLALWPHLSVFENVAFPLRARRERDGLRARVEAALERVRLTGYAHRYPQELSGGQQQRVAFARAIVGDPRLLLMDEPLSALDSGLRAALRTELAQLTRELGLTTVYVTHDQEEAMAMSDRILVMREGRIRQDSPPEELYRNPADPGVAELVGRFNHLPSDISPAALAGVRPERVGITDGAGHGGIRLNGRIAASAYVGGRYELSCRVEGTEHPWTVYAAETQPVGSTVSLHVASDDLLAFDSPSAQRPA